MTGRNTATGDNPGAQRGAGSRTRMVLWMLSAVSVALGVPAGRAAPQPDGAQAAKAVTAAKAYRQARALSARGHYAAAADALPTELSSLPQAVATDVRVRRARLLARAGRLEEARKAAQALAEEGSAQHAMSALAAECALALGDAAAAEKRLLALLARKRLTGLDRHAVALLYAEAATALGRPETASDALSEALTRAPEAPLASRVEAKLEALRAAHPSIQDDGDGHADASPALSLEERLQQALALTDAGEAKAAVATLAGQKPPRRKAERARFYHVRGMALFRTRERYKDAARDLQRAATLGSRTEASDAFHAARALSRADQDKAAVRGYKRFVRRYPKSRYVDDATYLAAWLSLRHGFAGGARAMQRFVDGRYGRRSTAWRQKGLFMLAMDAFLRRRMGRAEALFLRYAATSEAAMVAARGTYWAGRAAQAVKQKKRAKGHYLRALHQEPLHYYAQLARQRLAALGSEAPAFPTPERPPAPATATAAETGAPAALPKGSAAAFYYGLSLLPDAAAALRNEEDLVRKAGGLPALLHHYEALGDAARPYRLVAREVRDLLHRPPIGEARPYWQAAFPRPYAQEVASITAEVELAPDLLYAVVRKESAYDPNVVSSAAAIGLTQLLAETAARFAHDKPFEAARLFEPAYNLRIGASYLRALIDEFDGHVPLAVAAYNAGEHRVHAWLKRERKRERKRHGKIDFDVFVERIPISQTHNYVRRVLGNWARYRYLEAVLGETADNASFWPPLPEVL